MDWKQELEMYEGKEDWKSAVGLMDRISVDYPDDSEVWVRKLYLLHNVVLEHYPEKAGLDRKALEKQLLESFNETYEKFKSNPEYLFFMGVIGHIAEYYFGQRNLELSRAMIERAFELDPNNRLYEWQRLIDLGGADNLKKARQIARDIIESDSPEKRWLEARGFPGRYVLNTQLKGTAKFSDQWIERREEPQGGNPVFVKSEDGKSMCAFPRQYLKQFGPRIIDGVARSPKMIFKPNPDINKDDNYIVIVSYPDGEATEVSIPRSEVTGAILSDR